MRFILIFTVFLASCSIVADPSEGGGLLSTATNIATGSYDERLQKRQQLLLDAKTENQQLKQDNLQLEADKLALAKQIEVENQKLDEISSSIKSFKKKLKNSKKNSTKKDRKIRDELLLKLSELKSRNEKLQQQINANNSWAKIAAIQAERDRLDRELSLLLESSQQ